MICSELQKHADYCLEKQADLLRKVTFEPMKMTYKGEVVIRQTKSWGCIEKSEWKEPCKFKELNIYLQRERKISQYHYGWWNLKREIVTDDHGCGLQESDNAWPRKSCQGFDLILRVKRRGVHRRALCRIDMISLLSYESHNDIKTKNRFEVLCQYTGSR